MAENLRLRKRLEEAEKENLFLKRIVTSAMLILMYTDIPDHCEASTYCSAWAEQ